MNLQRLAQEIDWSRHTILGRTKVGIDFLASPVVTSKVARTEIYDVTDHMTGPLPDGSPTGYPWMLWKGRKSEIAHSGGFGLDSSGQWWSTPNCSIATGLVPGTGFCLWGPATIAPGGPDWSDQIQEFVVTVVLPTIALVVGTAVGGVGGIIAATIITSATKIARGGRVSDAVVSSTKDALPLVASGVFDKTIATAKSYGLDQMYAYGQKLAVSDEREAFKQAATLATAMVSQEKSLDELKTKYPEAADVIELAAKNQGSPLDIANAIGGESAKVEMDAALVRNAGGTPAPSGTTVGTVATAGLGIGALLLAARYLL